MLARRWTAAVKEITYSKISKKLAFDLNLFTKSNSYIANKMQEFYIIDLQVCINRINMNLHNDFLFLMQDFRYMQWYKSFNAWLIFYFNELARVRKQAIHRLYLLFIYLFTCIYLLCVDYLKRFVRKTMWDILLRQWIDLFTVKSKSDRMF